MSRGETTYVLSLDEVDAGALAAVVAARHEHYRAVESLEECVPAEHLIIVVAAGTAAMAALKRVRTMEAQEGWRHLGLLLVGAGPAALPAEVLQDPAFCDVLEPDADEARAGMALDRAWRQISSRREIDRLTLRVHSQSREMQELNRIGMALSLERDPGSLLEMILRKSREITGADAGSLYLIEARDGAEEVTGDYLANKQMRFRMAQNDSREVPYSEFVMEISHSSVAGHVAISGEVVNLPDAYDLPEGSPFTMNRSFDERTGYLTRSMLVVPMRNHHDETIGVVQLINRKRRFETKLENAEVVDRVVIPFDEKCRDLGTSLASQAAVALENSLLVEEIKSLFEGFIRASVTAIESRDPTTSGHSERVAALTVGLAEAVDRTELEELRDVKFTRGDVQEIRFASLLHDFGKIGVREPVLVKEKKLYAHELEAVHNRFEMIRQGVELNFSRQKLQYLLDRDREAALELFPGLETQCSEALQQLDECLDRIVQANEPTVLEKGGFEALLEIGRLTYSDTTGETRPYISEEEVQRLSIPKGSLSQSERQEIESHVTHTFRFLQQIPWSRDLRSVPEIAYAHHEKLNGSGYPRKLHERAIPIQSKMMTVSDIYDALTASDRPYKRAIPMSRALDILGYEVREGKLDPLLYKVFVEAKVFEKGRVAEG